MAEDLPALLVRDAVRTNCRPFIVFYGESGCGKTLSALYLARGLAGDSGKIVMVETESGRGEAYVDVLPPVSNPYKIIPLREPFRPERYVQAIELAEDSRADVVVVDSGSHEWEGAGGVLDQAGEIETRTKKAGLHCWKDPKFSHRLFVTKLMRSTVPVIVCLRAGHKHRQLKENGKTVIVRDEAVTPTQAADFLFEATLHAEIRQDHTMRVTKIDEVHPEIGRYFPEGKMMSIDLGRGLAGWCKGTPSAQTNQAARASGKQQAWTLLKPKHGGDVARFRQFLVDETIIRDDVQVEEITATEWPLILTKIEAALRKGQP